MFLVFVVVVVCLLSGVEGVALGMDVEVDDEGVMVVHLNRWGDGGGSEGLECVQSINSQI